MTRRGRKDREGGKTRSPLTLREEVCLGLPVLFMGYRKLLEGLEQESKSLMSMKGAGSSYS
jgi:hypothetical protein